MIFPGGRHQHLPPHSPGVESVTACRPGVAPSARCWPWPAAEPTLTSTRRRTAPHPHPPTATRRSRCGASRHDMGSAQGDPPAGC